MVIGNTVSIAERYILPAIEKRIERNAIGFNKNDVQINVAKLKKHSTVLGMVAFIVEEFFHTNVHELISE